MPDVFKSITRLVYHSNGGFGFQELYSEVPVYIRRFLVDEIESIKKREKEAIEGDGGGSEGIPDDARQAMEKMQKDRGHDGSQEKVQEDLKEVFGDEIAEDRKERTTAEERTKTPPSERTPISDQDSNKPELDKDSTNPDEDSDEKKQADPADAEDLEQMINKLKNDM